MSGRAMWVRLALIAECVLFLTPAAWMVLGAGTLSMVSLRAALAGEASASDLLLTALFGAAAMFGGVAVAEVVRVAVATQRGRALAVGRRTLWSAGAGVMGAAAGTGGIYALGDGTAGTGPVLVVLVLVSAVVLLSAQLAWQQRRLAGR